MGHQSERHKPKKEKTKKHTTTNKTNRNKKNPHLYQFAHINSSKCDSKRYIELRHGGVLYIFEF